MAEPGLQVPDLSPRALAPRPALASMLWSFPMTCDSEMWQRVQNPL